MTPKQRPTPPLPRSLSRLLSVVTPKELATLLLALARVAGYGFNARELSGQRAECEVHQARIEKLESRLKRVERATRTTASRTDSLAVKPGALTSTARFVTGLLQPWTWFRG